MYSSRWQLGYRRVDLGKQGLRAEAFGNTHRHARDRRSHRLLSGPTSSFCQPDARSTAILWNKLNAGFLERGYERRSGFGATTNISLGSLQSLDCRRRYPGVFGQVILGPPDQCPRRFYLPN